MPSLPTDPQWISAAVETPLMALLAWMLHSLRRTIAQSPEALPPPAACPPGPRQPGPDPVQQNAALERTREDLAAFKLEVARTYVPLSLIRDVDGRLTAHLIRIEQNRRGHARRPQHRRADARARRGPLTIWMPPKSWPGPSTPRPGAAPAARAVPPWR